MKPQAKKWINKCIRRHNKILKTDGTIFILIPSGWVRHKKLKPLIDDFVSSRNKKIKFVLSDIAGKKMNITWLFCFGKDIALDTTVNKKYSREDARNIYHLIQEVSMPLQVSFDNL